MDKNQIQNAFSNASRISENLTNNLKQNTNQITNNIVSNVTKLGSNLGQTLGLPSSSSSEHGGGSGLGSGSSHHHKNDKKKINRHHERTTALGDDGTLDCGCSLQSIMIAVNEIKQDPGFDSITMEDLILDSTTTSNTETSGGGSISNNNSVLHNRKIGAIHEMLVSTMVIGGGDGQKRSSLPTTTKAYRLSRPRRWTRIDFVDCINSKTTYLEYMDKRKKFYTLLKKHYNQTTMSVGPVMDLPLDFCIKMELNSKMEIFTCVQLFRIIVEDDNIDDEMEFSNVGALELKKYNTLSEALAASFDRSTLKWIGHNVDLNIFYVDEEGGESSRSLFLQNNKKQQQGGGVGGAEKEVQQQEQQQRPASKQRIKHIATKEGLKECARKLEKLAYQSSNTSILSSVTSQQSTITIEEEEAEE